MREKRKRRGTCLVVQCLKLWDPDVGWGDWVGSLVRELARAVVGQLFEVGSCFRQFAHYRC